MKLIKCSKALVEYRPWYDFFLSIYKLKLNSQGHNDGAVIGTLNEDYYLFSKTKVWMITTFRLSEH